MKQYLENIIKVVNNDDWVKLKNIELKTSKLKDMLHLLLDNRNKGIPTNRQIQDQLKIDDKLYRKMKSVLLVKCYNALAPEGNVTLLRLLSRYRLYNHFIRELEKQEKKINKRNLAEKQQFYNYAFHGLLILPYSLVKIELIRKYADKYLETVERKELHERKLSVQVRIFSIKILQHFFKKYGYEDTNSLMKELVEIRRVIAEKPTVTLEAILGLAAGMYYYYVEMNYNLSLSHLLSSKEIITQQKVNLTDDDKEGIDVFIALNYYQNEKFSEGLNVLSEVEKNFPTILKTQTHVINRMIELHLILGNMKEAKSILDNRLKRFIDIAEFDSAEIASISYLKYYLLSDDLNNAFLYLEKAREFLNKSFFTLHDIELRLMEIIYFIHNGDYSLANRLINRGIKFINEKSKQNEVILHLAKFKLLQRICRIPMETGMPENNVSEMIHQTYKGIDYLKGILILKGYQMRMKKAITLILPVFMCLSLSFFIK